MVQIALPFLAVILVGVGVALETPTNALLAKTAGSVLWASLFSFIIGALALGVALAIRRPALDSAWRQAPWYAWLGGLYGAFLVFASAWATPKLGAGTTLVVIVASQIALGVALDHFALLWLAPHSVSWLRIAGVVLVGVSAWLRPPVGRIPQCGNAPARSRPM